MVQRISDRVDLGQARSGGGRREIARSDAAGDRGDLRARSRFRALPRERQLRTTLERLSHDVAAHEIESPAIMVIGEIVRAAESADRWTVPMPIDEVYSKSDTATHQTAITLMPVCT